MACDVFILRVMGACSSPVPADRLCAQQSRRLRRQERRRRYGGLQTDPSRPGDVKKIRGTDGDSGGEERQRRPVFFFLRGFGAHGDWTVGAARTAARTTTLAEALVAGAATAVATGVSGGSE